MKLVLTYEGKARVFDGTLIKDKNNYYVEVYAPEEIKLGDYIDNIKCKNSFMGDVTLLNNVNTLISYGLVKPREYKYVYEVGYLVTGFLDEEDTYVSSMLIYYKEFDSFFVEHGYKINTENLKEEFSITQKKCHEILLKNDNLTIEYIKEGGVNRSSTGHVIFLNPANLKISFNKPIPLSNIFYEIDRIEKVFGFVIERKMNLIETFICDDNYGMHKVIVKYQKEYDDVQYEELHVVDVSSKKLLKDILKKYYEDESISSAINVFYEYICNELSYVFEFTSLVNTLELILSRKEHIDTIKKYAQDNNKRLKQNNKKMMDIFNILSEEQKKFISSFYKFENVELADRIKYTFYEVYKLIQNEKTDKYISSIVKTRNFYVHGTKSKKIICGIKMVQTKNLLNMMLYNLIIDICTKEKNAMIGSNEMLIPKVYNSIIDGSVE